MSSFSCSTAIRGSHYFTNLMSVGGTPPTENLGTRLQFHSFFPRQDITEIEMGHMSWTQICVGAFLSKLSIDNMCLCVLLQLLVLEDRISQLAFNSLFNCL